MPEDMRILVVDDDASVRTLVSRHLSAAGYEVVSVGDGAEALTILRAEGARIVVTDWMMPEMDGLDLCRAIRAQEGMAFTYVIVMTAHAGDEDRLVKAFDAGADDYVPKPIRRKELLARVRAAERMVRLQCDLDRQNREVHRVNAEIEIANRRLEEANEKLHRLATTDELTGLTNRRAAMECLSEQWAVSRRFGDPQACIMLDIDHFKTFNDRHGHAAGDAVLREVGSLLARIARRGERCCRIGGEEFLVLCPKSTEAMAAVGAERLRTAVEAHPVVFGKETLYVTISAGVAERSLAVQTPDDLFRAADAALYAAKEGGRNRVCVASTRSPADPKAGSSMSAASVTARDPFSDEPVEAARILIVDDDPLDRLVVHEALAKSGYRVTQAGDGCDALEKVAADPPDVILTDVAMPRMDGLEFVRRLKSAPQTRGIPVIILSGRTEWADVTSGIGAGADEYLTKPVQTHELALRVRSMVRLRRELIRSNEVRGEQSRALTLLLEFSHRIAAAESLEDVLEATVAATAELTCCRRISIMLPDAAGESLSVVRSMGLDPQVARETRVARGDATVGQVFASGTRVVINDADEANNCWPRYDSQFFASVPLVCEALSASEHIVGVLNITDRQGGRPFSPLELEYVDLIGNIAASAIHDYLTRQARDEAYESIVIALAKLAEYRDSDTGRHLDRVTRFCVILAEELRAQPRFRSQITDQFLQDLERAVPLHDIGKVAVPDQILNKPGPLTSAEREVMRAHAAIGASTLRSVIARAPGAGFLAMAEEIAFAHHEWFDGGGYPRGIRGEDIPLAARIVAVADVYDALTTRRVYKDAMSHEQAAGIVRRSAGTQFDPAVVAAFQRRDREFALLAAELADDPTLPPPRSRAIPGEQDAALLTPVGE